MAETTVPAPTGQTAPPQAREMTRAEEMYIPPPVDIYEDDQGLVVLADMPGVDPDNLDIRVDRGVLTIRGSAHHLVEKHEPVYREFELTGFFRQFQLPNEIDTEKISAELKHGVLTLRLPRSPQAQPRRIEVRASGG